MPRAPAGSGRFVGDQQVFQQGDAGQQLQPAVLQALALQLVFRVGGQAGNGRVQRAALGAQGLQAGADLGQVVRGGVHPCTVHHRRAGWLRRPGRAGTGDRGEPVEWAA